jgi:hypothetical protein
MRPRITLFLFACLSTLAQAATSVTQFGITWTFNGDYPVGQYCNGDYYVVAPSGLSIPAISPGSTIDAVVSPGRVMSGTMVNPIPGAQGWDSLSGQFNAALNAGRPGGNALNSGNPLVVAAGSSVVTQISMLNPSQGWGNRPMTSDAAVLTIVAAAPAAGSFRPPYCGTLKPSWNKSSLNYGVLGTLAPVTSTPTLATTAAYNARPWMEVITTWESRQSHPTNNQPEYGRDMAYQTGDALLRLQLNDSNANKETALINLVQYGIDIYGASINGATWSPDGGHCMGRKSILLLAGKVLGDSGMLAYADYAQHNIFQDDQGVVVVNSAVEAAIPLTSDGNVRSAFAPKSATVTISNASPAVVTWPTTAATCTISNGNPAVITLTGHGFQNARAVQFSTTGALPAGITAGVTYWVQPSAGADGNGPATSLTANTFNIGTVINQHVFGNGAIVATTTAGSGTQTVTVGHGFKRQMPIVFSTTGALPSPLVSGTEYWIRDPGTSLNTFQITPYASNDDSGDGSAINTTTTGSGTQTASFALTSKVIWSVKGSYESYQWAGSNFDAAYHGINMSSQTRHALGVLLISGGKVAWNNNNYFTMIDRDVAVSGYYNSPSNFSGYMWQAYRAGAGGGSDTTAPTPNPATIASTSHTSSTIGVVANPASDETALGTAPYHFSSDAGATWSAYQSSASYTFSGLTAATTYQLRVQYRDAAGNVGTQSAINAVSTDVGSGGGSPPGGGGGGGGTISVTNLGVTNLVGP